jgi:hypothetical protein
MNFDLKYISPSCAFARRKDFRRSSFDGSSLADSVEGFVVALIGVASISACPR